MILIQNLEKAAEVQEDDEYDNSSIDDQQHSSEALLSYH
jgi:hypothetical protein